MKNCLINFLFGIFSFRSFWLQLNFMPLKNKTRFLCRKPCFYHILLSQAFSLAMREIAVTNKVKPIIKQVPKTIHTHLLIFGKLNFLLSNLTSVFQKTFVENFRYALAILKSTIPTATNKILISGEASA